GGLEANRGLARISPPTRRRSSVAEFDTNTQPRPVSPDLRRCTAWRKLYRARCSAQLCLSPAGSIRNRASRLEENGVACSRSFGIETRPQEDFRSRVSRDLHKSG